MMMLILASECRGGVHVWGVLYQSLSTWYQFLLTQFIVSCREALTKFSYLVLLGIKYFCYVTYCSCKKSSCPLSLRYCQSPIVNPRLTRCHSIFSETQAMAYCLLTIVSCSLFGTRYLLTNQHSLSNKRHHYQHACKSLIWHCACQIYCQIAYCHFQTNKETDLFIVQITKCQYYFAY